jgi:hypothetical protein
LVVTVATIVLGGSGVTAQSADLIVGEGEKADFNSIQRAISSTNENSRIAVQPGDYQVSNGIYINKNIELIAPQGATIILTGEDSYGISIDEQAAPEIAGFTITGHTSGGVAASDTTEDWVIRDTVIIGGEYGIQTFHSTGDWVIKNVTVRDSAERGLSVDHSTGDWTISSTQVHDIPIEGIDAYQTDNGLIKDVRITNIGQDGINLYDTESWTLENVTIQEVGDEAINAGDGNTTGTQTIRDTAIRDTGDRGISFYGSNADWTVTRSLILNTDNESIDASEASGDWSVTESSFPDSTGTAIKALGSNPPGETTNNYWGASDGPSGDFSGSGSGAVGNVVVNSYYETSPIPVQQIGSGTKKSTNTSTTNVNNSNTLAGFDRFLSTSPVIIVFGGIIVGPIFGYGLYRLIRFHRNRTTSTSSTSDPISASDASTDNSDSPDVIDNHSTAGEHRSNAETAIETALTAKSSNNLAEAVDAYSNAINEYQAAVESLDAEATEQRAEIEKEIESARADLEAVKTRHDQRNEVITALQAAERSIQEAIVAFVDDKQTISRIRFRQARDTFEEVITTIAETDDNLLTPPIELSIEPDRELSSTTLGELPAIPDVAASKLAETDVETINELGTSEEPPWIPPAVAELTDADALSDETVAVLTILSWWHDGSSCKFETAEKVTRRQQQADYGFNQT